MLQVASQARVARTVESVLVVAVRPSKQGSGLACPWESRELVDRRHEECRDPPVERLVDGDYRQGAFAAELAFEVHEVHPRIEGLSVSGTRSNDSGENFSLHQGHSSRGIGEGFLSGSLLN